MTGLWHPIRGYQDSVWNLDAAIYIGCSWGSDIKGLEMEKNTVIFGNTDATLPHTPSGKYRIAQSGSPTTVRGRG